MIDVQKKNDHTFFKLFLSGLVSIVLFTFIYNLLLNPYSENSQNMTVISLSMFAVLRSIFVIPIIEEFVFRLGIQNLFKRLSNSNLVAVLFTSLIFAYVHNDTIFLPYFWNSLIFGISYIKSGHSIKIPILLHMTNNLLSFLV